MVAIKDERPKTQAHYWEAAFEATEAAWAAAYYREPEVGQEAALSGLLPAAEPRDEEILGALLA